ncbi:hypothetical protein NP590_14520 [Methylomonas sp. SURF-2]|uniref:Uncharacterized protein n=1 Tax=Methylomonas subterranea TaxID=2952225 RepID=A0ABT1TIM4_9GAMM|nr:hypothetical protein [Methylomonas sp. SURF-2]MCQ8105326.1 hypothetical protein [Methylomonas sp. SURF-2]
MHDVVENAPGLRKVPLGTDGVGIKPEFKNLLPDSAFETLRVIVFAIPAARGQFPPPLLGITVAERLFGLNHCFVFCHERFR